VTVIIISNEVFILPETTFGPARLVLVHLEPRAVDPTYTADSQAQQELVLVDNDMRLFVRLVHAVNDDPPVPNWAGRDSASEGEE
jgi:hypothetical protein